jgi:UDP-N-acetylmuramoyl-tripeptide--D-alanyl-D-alanine ligase
VSARFTVADVTAALGRAPEATPGRGPAAPQAPGAEPAVFGRVSIDSRRLLPGDLFVALKGDRYDGSVFLADAVRAGATGAIGEDRPFEGRQRVAFWPVPDGRAALQALAAWHRRRLPARVVAVTGSNGKTTTKELLAAVLSQRWPTARTIGNLNNQVGVPLTIFEIDERHAWAVVEMGMNRPGEIAPLAAITAPDVGIVTNVAASHLEGLGTLEAILEEKLALGRALEEEGLLVYFGDQPRLATAARRLPCRKLSFGLDPSNDLAPERWELDEDGRGRFVLDGKTYRLRLAGRHNIANALAAVAVGRLAGLTPGEIAVGLAEVEALAMRMQVERWGEVTAIVDCYNANPESVLSAAGTLATLAGARRRIAVLGEMLELGPGGPALHEEVGRALADSGAVDLLVAVGEGAAGIADGARAGGLASERFADHDSATRWLVERLEPGDAILFKASRGAALESMVAPIREACLEAIPREAAR